MGEKNIVSVSNERAFLDGCASDADLDDFADFSCASHYAGVVVFRAVVFVAKVGVGIKLNN